MRISCSAHLNKTHLIFFLKKKEKENPWNSGLFWNSACCSRNAAQELDQNFPRWFVSIAACQISVAQQSVTSGWKDQKLLATREHCFHLHSARPAGSSFSKMLLLNGKDPRSLRDSVCLNWCDCGGVLENEAQRKQRLWWNKTSVSTVCCVCLYSPVDQYRGCLTARSLFFSISYLHPGQIQSTENFPILSALLHLSSFSNLRATC